MAQNTSDFIFIIKNRLNKLIFPFNYIQTQMGNTEIAQLCSSKPKGLPVVNNTNFMNKNLHANIKKRKDLFQGIISTFSGTARSQWVPLQENLMYKGEWKNQKRHGRGVLYDKKQQSLLVGCFYENNLILTKCRKIYANGTQYVGEVNQARQLHGIGKVTGNKYTYQGQLKNNKFDGEGQLERQNINFKGKFQQGRKKYGLQITPQGTYEGPFVNQQREGEGVFQWANGGKYQGPFRNNRLDGKGKLYDADGKFVGNHLFVQGKRVQTF